MKKEEKKILRKELREQRKNLPSAYRKRAEGRICENVRQSEIYQKAENVFCYVSTPEEVDTWDLMEDILASGKTLAVPLCRGKGVMEARKITSLKQLKSGAYGIFEPGEETPVLEPEKIDLALIPCVSCSKKGVRLGYGGGYYDRFLPRTGAVRVILCHEQMLCKNIPSEPHDCGMDILVTEAAIYTFGTQHLVLVGVE